MRKNILHTIIPAPGIILIQQLNNGMVQSIQNDQLQYLHFNAILSSFANATCFHYLWHFIHGNLIKISTNQFLYTESKTGDIDE